MFFKSKDEKIKIAEENGFRKAERIYQAELDDARADYRDREKELIKKHRAEAEQEVKLTEIRMGVKIAELLEEITNLKEQRKKDQQAWAMFKNYIPEMLKYANFIKGVKQIDAEETARNFQRAVELENSLDFMQRRIESITPRVEKLYGSEGGGN